MKPGIGIQRFFSLTEKWGLTTEEILITCHLGVGVITTSLVCRAINSARFGGGGGGCWEPLAWSGLNPSGVPRVAPTI
jgi:hypothetical protein